MRIYNQWSQPLGFERCGCDENPRSRSKSGGTQLLSVLFYHRAAADFKPFASMCSCVTSLWKVGAISVSLANDILHNFEIKNWCNDQGRTGNKTTRDTTSKASRVGAQVAVRIGVTVVGDVEACSYESFLGIHLGKATETTASFIWLPICKISPKSCSVWQVFGSCLKHHGPNLLMLICRFSYSLRQI